MYDSHSEESWCSHFFYFVCLSQYFKIFIIPFSGLNAPRITENPLDVMVPRFDPVTLNCKAEGSPVPTISWYKNNELLQIEPGSHRMILPSGGLFFLKVSFQVNWIRLRINNAIKFSSLYDIQLCFMTTKIERKYSQ